jgi:hypothetical protein
MVQISHSEMPGPMPSDRQESATSASASNPPPRKKQRRGFAAMDPAKQREIASKGGRASHEKGTGHEWTSDTARSAGRKGGLASHGGRGKRTSTKP